MDNRLKECFNLIADIIAKQEEKQNIPPHKAYTNAGTIDGKSTDKQIVCWLRNQPNRM